MTTTTHPSPPATMSQAELERWLDGYGRAWEARDGEAGAGLFTQDARYHWGPFDVLHGRAEIARRWAAATSGQRDIHFEHTALAVAGGRAFVHWRATFERTASGMFCELDGVLVLRFDQDGLCSELREWWLARETATPDDSQTTDDGRNS